MLIPLSPSPASYSFDAENSYPLQILGAPRGLGKHSCCNSCRRDVMCIFNPLLYSSLRCDPVLLQLDNEGAQSKNETKEIHPDHARPQQQVRLHVLNCFQTTKCYSVYPSVSKLSTNSPLILPCSPLLASNEACSAQ